MTLAIFLAVLIGAILLGIPVAFSLLLSAMALMLYLDVFSADILAQSLVNGVDSGALLAIPLFLVAGETMAQGGLSKYVVRLAMAAVGHHRGGLGYVVIVVAVVLAGLSGSATADAAALVAILFPMMQRAGYPEPRSAGLLAAGSIIAPVIPPSVPLILIGVAGNISIAKLFMAGLTPGLMMGLALMLVWRRIARHDQIPANDKASKSELCDAFRAAIWALFLPIIIVVGIRFGIFTPIEAAAVAAVYAVLVSTFVYRELTVATFYKILIRAGKSTGMIIFLVGCAMVAAWLITVAQLPQQLTEILQPMIDSPRLLMATIMVLVFLVGMVMDLSPTVLILVPLLMPLVKLAGIDPVYFGVMFIMNASIGLITPPVGTVLNVVCGIGKVRLEKVAVGVLPFVGIYLFLLVMFTIFPQLIIVPMQIIAG